MWWDDPVTKIKSASLTLVVWSFIVLVAVGVLQVFGKVSTTGPFLELFITCAALYFGRRVTFKGQVFASEKTEGENKNV